jgi:diguanylate cyclase (GGDEF)-like protein
VNARTDATDGLTGISNRRHFLALAESEWARFQRYHRPMSLLIIDVDRFKSINDEWGHDVGDVALSHVAKLCLENKRTSDIVARIGGEEFAALLPETELREAAVVAERLRQALKDHPLKLDDSSIAMTISIGIAEASTSMAGVGALMKKADQALYLAKAAGRNRTQVGLPMSIVRMDQAAE